MINLISNLNLSLESKTAIAEEVNSAYEKLLKINVEVANIEILRGKVEAMKGRYADMLFD